MEKIEYLPLGSIVLLKGGTKKVMIIARGLEVKLEGKITFLDYGGVQYPEGLIGDELAYFNHDGIRKVIFKGYRDEDDEIVAANIREYLASGTVARGDVEKLREEKVREEKG